MSPICAVDGTLQIIQRPSKLRQRVYYNGKRRAHALNHMACCDYTGKFTAVFPGFYGSVHDSNAYRATPLFTHKNDWFGDGETLLGDSGFEGCGIDTVQKKNSKTNQSEEEQWLNMQRKANRVVIEAAFGYNQYKWKVLRQKWRWDLNKAPLVFKLCCQLSNMLFDKYGALRGEGFLVRKELLEWEKKLQSVYGLDGLDSKELKERLTKADDLYEEFERLNQSLPSTSLRRESAMEDK